MAKQKDETVINMGGENESGMFAVEPELIPLRIVHLPTEAEARAYWSGGRTKDEAEALLREHSIRAGGWGHFAEGGFQTAPIWIENPLLPHTEVIYYLPGQEAAAQAEARRLGIVE